VFGLGVPELVIILIIALVIFGPKKLPEIGGAVGKAIREFRKASDEIKRDVSIEPPKEK
jgi:sec-independent protein translocase protein TatA